MSPKVLGSPKDMGRGQQAGSLTFNPRGIKPEKDFKLERGHDQIGILEKTSVSWIGSGCEVPPTPRWPMQPCQTHPPSWLLLQAGDPWSPPRPLASHTHSGRRPPTSYDDVSTSLIIFSPSSGSLPPRRGPCSSTPYPQLSPPSCPPPGLGCQPPWYLFMAVFHFSSGSAFRPDKY